MFVLPMSKTKR